MHVPVSSGPVRAGPFSFVRNWCYRRSCRRSFLLRTASAAPQFIHPVAASRPCKRTIDLVETFAAPHAGQRRALAARGRAQPVQRVNADVVAIRAEGFREFAASAVVVAIK